MCIWPSESLSLPSCNTSSVTSPLPRLNFFHCHCCPFFFSHCAVTIFSLSCLLVCLFSLMLFSHLHYLLLYLFSSLSFYLFLLFRLPLSSPSSPSLPSSLITLTLSDYTTCVWLPFALPHHIQSSMACFLLVSGKKYAGSQNIFTAGSKLSISEFSIKSIKFTATLQTLGASREEDMKWK